MGGFTEIYLRDKSIDNIREQNKKLKAIGVTKMNFYSDDDVRFEWEAFKNSKGVFPEHLFPKDKIKTYSDFKRFWSPKALGSCFCPNTGSLIFDCYFGRTSKRQMKLLRKYLMDYDFKISKFNIDLIEKTSGSFSTFVERGGFTKLDQEMLKDRKLI
jgi:hypothetical protein